MIQYSSGGIFPPDVVVIVLVAEGCNNLVRFCSASTIGV